MSSGGYTDDFRRFGELGLAPGQWVGSYTNKNWNGADQPKAVGTPSSRFYVLREERLENGRTIVKRFKVRKPGTRPPKRKKNGEHAYEMNYLRLEHNFAFYQPSGPLVADLQSVLTPGSWSAQDLLGPNDQIKLVGKLREKLQGSDFNMSVFLGEGHQTLKLLGDSAIRIAKGLFHLKKLDFYGCARSLLEGTSRKPLPRHDWVGKRPIVPTAKNLSSLWLELQYGWKPLLSDAEGAAQQLAHSLGTPFRTTHRASVRKEEVDTVTASGSNPGFEWTASAVRTKTHRRSLIARISEDPISIPQLLGLKDPELVAWELTPFSFVADWFIPIGDWMSARALAKTLVGTFITSDLTTGYVERPTCSGPGLVMADPAVRGRYGSASFKRAISTTLEVPMPKFKGLEKAASWQHCANAIALVIGAAGAMRNG